MCEAEEKIEKCEECGREIEPDTEDAYAFSETNLCDACWERESKLQRQHEESCVSLLYNPK